MKKGFKFKLTGFTLTELLVVVIVIGVLSAAVLPKFNKVIETRKTTEAEELMSSIRTEQEKRCALDKPYLTDLSNMKDIVKNGDTKNYELTLQDKGVIATSKGSYSYNLQMPSYADGRICCDGDDCGQLNKNYPSCKGFTYEESPDSCAGTPAEPEVKSCTGQAVTERACASGCGTERRTAACNTSTGNWEYGAWDNSCTAKPASESRECGTGYTGTQTRSAVCKNGVWEMGDWTGMCTKVPECTGPSSRACGCDSLFMTSKKGTQTRTCDTSTGTWREWSSCSGFTEWDRQQCDGGGDEEWQCVYDSARDRWSWVERVACQGGLGGDGDSCTWQDVAVFGCDPADEEAARAVCARYSQCSVNNYCPGKGITAEACI